MRAGFSLRFARFSRVTGILAIAVLATLGASPSEQNKKPSISLRANPPVGFSPLRVVVTAELKGGADDYEDFYCASVEWEWGDDTKLREHCRLRSLRAGQERNQATLRAGAHVPRGPDGHTARRADR